MLHQQTQQVATLQLGLVLDSVSFVSWRDAVHAEVLVMHACHDLNDNTLGTLSRENQALLFRIHIGLRT